MQIRAGRPERGLTTTKTAPEHPHDSRAGVADLYMLSFPETLGRPTIPATDIRYADPDGEGRYIAI